MRGLSGVQLACMVALTTLRLDAQPGVALSGELDGGTLTVRGVAGDSTVPEPVFQAAWRAVGSASLSFDLQRTAFPADDIPLTLDQLMEAAIGTYLDAHVRFAKQGVEADLSPARMLDDLAALASAAADRLGVPGLFTGFSEPTLQQLTRITRIDWSQARFGIDGGDDQDKYLAIYYYVRTQRDELERQLRADLLPLREVAVLGTDGGHPGTQVRIASSCGTVFDDQNFLCALDLTVSDTLMADPGMDPATIALLSAQIEEEAALPDPAPARVRKRDRWLKAELDAINDRIDRMDQRKELWAIRDRLDDVEGRLDDLQLQVDEVREQGVEGENPGATLSALTGRNITIRFARNATTLDPEYRVLLNEVFEQLARNPSDRILITGFTDRSGDAALNMQLSEKRARAVRNYLLQRGIDQDRLMVNYYGDSRSGGRDPNERRVEIEWLPR